MITKHIQTILISVVIVISFYALLGDLEPINAIATLTAMAVITVTMALMVNAKDAK